MPLEGACSENEDPGIRGDVDFLFSELGLG